MGGEGSGRKPSVETIIKRNQPVLQPIADGMFLPNLGGVQDMARKGGDPKTAGSVLFIGPTGNITQDNTNFFWDDANNQLNLNFTTKSIIFQDANGLQEDNTNFTWDNTGKLLETTALNLTGNFQVNGGVITSTTGAISFVNENLSTTGTLAAGVTTITGDQTINQTADSVGLRIVGFDDSSSSTLDIEIRSGGAVDLITSGTNSLNFRVGGATKLSVGSTGPKISDDISMVWGNNNDFQFKYKDASDDFTLFTGATDVIIFKKTGITKLLGVAPALTSKTADYTATEKDHTILVSGSAVVTLPSASSVTDIIYNIKNIGGGTVTVSGSAIAENIDGSITAVISTQFASISIHCDGTEWHII